jgi:DMSO/TMAO reductase YedYZ molybdopterin-dependent catalytic subunit
LFRRDEEKEKPRLPPDQRWVDHILKWGVEHRGIVPTLPNIDKDKWKFKVHGLVEKPKEYSWDDFMALSQVVSVSDFHCVETWSVKDQKWEGVRFNTIIEDSIPEKKAKYVLFQAYDSYTTSLPISELIGENIVLAHKLNDEPLPQSLGGPMRLIVPQKYAYKSIMWLADIEFSDRDKLGYWERNGYHNNADPWRRQRFS